MRQPPHNDTTITAYKRNPVTKLSGEWEFQPDPEDQGASNEWASPETNWTDATVISVPHSWQEEKEWRDYTGTAWYRRTFDFDSVKEDEQVHISFGAVDYEATVWVNGSRIGIHRGGYLPFSFRITDALEPGENTVVLRVFDPEDISEIPHGKQGRPWYSRVSGPWQRIDLLVVPETHITDVRVSPDLSNDTATFDVSALGDSLDVKIALRCNGNQVTESTGRLSDGECSIRIDVPNAMYWTPDDPVLYDFTVSLSEKGTTVDSYEDQFGMRSIDYKNGEIYLNDEPIFVRGALDQAFYPDTYYRPRDLKTFDQEIQAAKDLGFNMLRKHIKPAHPVFLKRADQLGLLVWEEPANPDLHTERSKRELRAQLEEMIDRDYNRPSVVTWSIYNEEWGIGNPQGLSEETSLWEDTEKQDYLESLYQDITREDPTRLVCDNSGWAHVATDINDYHEYFITPDRLNAWRNRLDEITESPSSNYGDARTDPATTPILISEFGSWGMPTVSRIVDHYDGDPHWFDHEFLSGLKRPAGVRKRFAESYASDVFDSLDELAAAWQHREFESIEPIIADMRENEGIAGYVITELSDIEWEFNGILDYFRDEKEFATSFAHVNAPVMAHLDLKNHAIESGDELVADLIVVNDTADPVDTSVEWEAFGESELVDLEVDAHGSERLKGAVDIEAPAVDNLESETITATMAEPARTISQPVFIAPTANKSSRALDETIFVANDQFRKALESNGYNTTTTTTEADIAIVADPDAYDADTVLIVPQMNGELEETNRVTYTRLPKQESWNLCACFVYQDLLPNIDTCPGWAFEDLYPYGYVSEMQPDDDVAIGYTEGWVENSGGIALLRESNEEATGVCTLRVTDAYGDHPIATAVVDRLIDRMI